MAKTKTFDVDAFHHGSVMTFKINSEEAREWWEGNVEAGPSFGGNPAVETRYGHDIIAGLEAAGFEVDKVDLR